MRVREHQAGQVAPLGLDEAQIGQNYIDTWIVFALGEGDAEVYHQPLLIVGGAEAVEIAIHADLADAAERHEHQFLAQWPSRSVLVRRHQPASPEAAAAIATSPNVTV